MRSFRHACCGASLLALVAIVPATARAHHDGPVLPLSLNAPGAVGGLGNPAGQTETKFGLTSRVFRVSDHGLYGPPLAGGDATIIFHGLYGAWALSPHWSLEALLPVVTDLPDGERSSQTGIGDVRLGARRFAAVEAWRALWAVSLETALPTGDATRGFGADAFVSRLSTRLAKDLAEQRLRLFIEGGLAWAWQHERGTLADVAAAAMWQALAPLGLFFEARVLTAVERGREIPLEFVGRTRAPGDTSVVLTPALMLFLGKSISVAAGPQIPLGFRDFDFGFALSATYRLPSGP